MPFTIRDIPPDLEDEIRDAARRRGVSVDEVAVEALRNGLARAGTKKRDLSRFVGIWRPDPTLDAAIANQRRVDPEDSG